LTVAVLKQWLLQLRETDYGRYMRSRCGHYIFVLWFLSSFFFFFIPRLILAVVDWMSTILLHMVWP